MANSCDLKFVRILFTQSKGLVKKKENTAKSNKKVCQRN